MKLLFVARHFTYFRNFDGVIRLLAERGHQVHLAAERDEALGGRDLVDRLAAGARGITVGYVPARRDERWFAMATVVRRSLDYLRYAAPMYDAAPKIRARAWERTPQLALALARWPARSAIEQALASLDRAMPIDPAIDGFVEQEAPDLVLLTPLIELGSPQLDILRSARRQGRRTALAVWSWDHLTSKARIRELPDRVLVWNETQQREATALHGVPPERITVTGAQCFDHWFGRAPSRPRDAFCREMGLDPARPFVLYVCSALFRGSPSEAAFVTEWVRHLRQSADPAVREAGVLVRPHPQRMYEWDGIELPAGIAFKGGHPIDAAGRDDYFDSLYHAAAVVGVNTSAMIEAAVVGRPVLTVLLPAFSENQTGTLHFRYLLDAPGGLLHAAGDLAAHERQLAAALGGRLEDRNAAFVRRFVRPRGLEAAATPAFVEALEEQGRAPAPPPARFAMTDRLWAPVARAWYAAAEAAPVRRLMMEASHALEEQDRAQRLAAKQARVRARDGERRARAAAKDDRYRDKRRKQRVARMKTVVRRVLAGAGGRDAGAP